MHKVVTLAAALCFIAGPALAQTPAIETLSRSEEAKGIVVPNGSAMRLASVSREGELKATFAGQVEVSGTFEIRLLGGDAFARLWPDQKSKDRLPHWSDRGSPDEIYIINGWDFAREVAGQSKLADLKAEKLLSISGAVTIIADEYETSIECDSAQGSARFVLVMKGVEVGGETGGGGGC